MIMAHWLTIPGDAFNITAVAAKYEAREGLRYRMGRIDMDDIYAAPLVVTSDTEETSFELEISSNPGTLEWTVGYY